MNQFVTRRLQEVLAWSGHGDFLKRPSFPPSATLGSFLCLALLPFADCNCSIYIYIYIAVPFAVNANPCADRCADIFARRVLNNTFYANSVCVTLCNLFKFATIRSSGRSSNWPSLCKSICKYCLRACGAGACSCIAIIARSYVYWALRFDE